MENMTSQNTLNTSRKAWEHFVKTGQIDETIIRPCIASSWQRCRKDHLDPFMSRSKDRLSDTQIKKRIEYRKELVHVAWPFMELLYHIVEGSGFRVDLVDEEGYILKMIGDLEAMKISQDTNSLVGANRSEKAAGTNSMGLVLISQEPVQIAGAEHYLEFCQRWTCSAAPILDQEQKLIGILNMSGRNELVHKHTLGMVVAVAKAIENEMNIQKINQQLRTTLQAISDGIIYINTQNTITYVNPMAEEILGINHTEIVNQPFDQVFTTSPSLHQVSNSGKGFSNHEIVIHVGKQSFHCIVSARPIISAENTNKGMVVVLKKTAEIRRMAQNMVGTTARFTFKDIIGESDTMQQHLKIAELASQVSSRVLIEGESGTGKEMVAQAIHNASLFQHGPFVAVNCSAIPHDLIESELFGYEEGAFTGAKRGGKPGKFELAEGGTLFLDEIGDMPLDMQVKMLRVLQENQVVRVGGRKALPLHIRVIAATNKNLLKEIEKGHFREDLYYRLNVIKLLLPSLRERCEDIPLLVNKILHKVCNRMGTPLKNIHPNAMEMLTHYSWPGNIRQLENLIERMVVLNRKDEITTEDLPKIFWETPSVEVLNSTSSPKLISLNEMEAITIKRTLQILQGNISKTAQTLGITRKTLYQKIKKYEI